MEKKFVKNDHKFSIKTTKSGKVMLSYEGKVNDFPQGYIWICDDEAEAMDMVDAIIDPKRYADDEYRARHFEEMYSRFKW